MIFRSSKKREAAAVADRGPDRGGGPATDVDQVFSEIDALTRRNRERRDPEIERRVLQLRHEAGLRVAGSPLAEPPHEPEPRFDLLPDGAGVPEVAPAELNPELLRAAILSKGSLLVRGLLEPDDAIGLAREIELAFQAWETKEAGGSPPGGYYDEFQPNPPFNLAAERGWVSDAAGIWGADSPKVMVEVLEAFEGAGLRHLATAYLGERPAISVNKCTLRRVRPDVFGGATVSGFHQDGAFLGDVRALNVWLSLSRCGDVAPGLDIVPRRIDHIVPTGTEGAAFDWSASRAVVEEAAGDATIARPIFEPGDVLLFDELCLHSTAADPEMPNTRYAVESWFFGPSAFPRDYAPLAF
jgi:hypothetical protein